MRITFGCWRSMSTAPMCTTHWSPNFAHSVAVATPCMPAPVSAITRGLPMRFASMIWPSTLFTLCAPVWLQSSRLR